MRAIPEDGSADANLQIDLVGRIALLSIAILAILGLFGFGIALPRLAAAFKGDPNAVLLSQLVGGVVGLAFALGSPFAGRLVDRFGYRTVLLVGCIAFAVVGSAGGLLNDLYAILLTRLLLGFTLAGALVASLSGIGLLPVAERARMFGLQALVGGLLSMAIYPLVGAMAAVSWRLPFALHLIGLVLAPLVLTLPRGHGVRRSGSIPNDVAKGERLAGLPLPVLLVAVFMGMANLVGPLFSPFFLIRIGVANSALQAIPLMAMGPAAILSSGAFGWLHRRFGAFAIFTVALALAGIGMVLGGLSHSVVELAVALFITSLGLAIYTPNLSAAAVHFGVRNPGSALGLANGVLYGAQAAFPFVSSAINQHAGPAAVFEIFGLSALALAAVHSWIAIVRRRRALAAAI